MDWKYVQSLDWEDINDEEKDELYNIVTWFDLDGETLEETKFKVLLRTCQEILKYKGEQVETLLHELEEMAVKQAEDEARRQESETDLKSSKSRKSSSIEYENLEQKYLELKTKHKKTIKNNEKHQAELNKLNNKLKVLEQENRRLQNELQAMPHEAGSESDYSDSIKDRQKELVETLHNKNRQISDLLRDIEEVENENTILRDKLSKVRDELAVATKEILTITDFLKIKEEELKENTDRLSTVAVENDKVKKELEIITTDKRLLEEKFKKTVEELKTKLKDVQEEVEAKNEEILDLKIRLKEPSVNSSLSSLPKDDPELSLHVSALQRALSDREQQLLEVQTQLRIATKEMDDSTALLTKLKAQKEQEQNKVKEYVENITEMKKQLKNVHDRCQKLHDELMFAEETARSKDEELNSILDKLQEDGQGKLAVHLKTVSDLKSDNRSKEKQIIALVRDSNRLQENCDILEKENCSLRETVGLSPEDQVNLSGYTSKQKKLKKEIDYLKHQLVNKEDIVLQLRTDIQKLTRMNSTLTDQISDLGHKPSYDSKMHATNDTNCFAEENRALVEENEALRKGLHEVMSCLNEKKSHLEIKSETLEKLLRTLDVKHITGWYHPAMRLQAELHNLEGINSELREQLRQSREKGVTTQKVAIKELVRDEEKDDADCRTFDSGIQSEEIYSDNLEENINNLFTRCKNPTDEDMEVLHQKILSWVKQSLVWKSGLEESLKSSEKNFKALQEEHDLLLEKLKILISETDEEKVKKINEVIASNINLNRKVIYLENEIKKMCEKSESLVNKFREKESNFIKNIKEIENENKHLESSVKILKNLNSVAVNFEAHTEMEKNLNKTTAKYRELIATIKKQEEQKSLEFIMLLESQKSLEIDKADLTDKLMKLMSKEALFSVKESDEKAEKLSQKLAESEVKEITERQRANHINNLYELVKEQLCKSEEKFKEHSKFNEELFKKNLNLQEQLKEAEEKICDYVDRTTYEQLRTENSELVKENENLTVDFNKLLAQFELEKQQKEFDKSWNNSKEQELLNLKHQIVDLVSVSDEKVIIAQLSGDVLQNRKSVEYYKVSVNGLNEELKRIKDMYEKEKKEYEEELCLIKEREKAIIKKIGNLQTLLSNQKLQFYGCVPLISEELYVSQVVTINEQKHESFLALQQAKELEKEAKILKEQVNIELEFVKKRKEIESDSYKDEYKKMANWMQEKKTYKINELRFKRQTEFKESELQHYMQRVKIQDEQISKLDRELLRMYKSFDLLDSPLSSEKPVPVLEERSTQTVELAKPKTPEPRPRSFKLGRSVSVQVSEADVTPLQSSPSIDDHLVVNLKSELSKMEEYLNDKESRIDQLENKLTEQEGTISKFRKQLGDKQSQISFYERHIMELQNKKNEVANGGAGGDNITVGSETNGQNEELLLLKNSIKTLQDEIKIKDEQIMKFQTLLKIDRDKHSLAAATLQEELQNLQKQLIEEKQKVKSLEETHAKSRTNRAALEQYVSQVHALEKHASELHTKLSTLEIQLQSSRQEAVRWRTMANDRLSAMENLRRDLDKQHQNEMALYKSDTEKMRELGNDEINSLRQLILRQKGELTGRLDTDIQRLVREKDDKIHEMIIRLRQIKQSAKRTENLELDMSPKLSDLESTKELLLKENDLLKKRYEQLLIKEKSAKDEIRDLKSQLLKKPISARSDKSEKSIKDQLQKKITTLENEIVDLKQHLNEQIALNESHRIQASEDFDKWKKMKYFQQNAEKLKNKLKERDAEFEKLQQTSAGYKHLIERLEREKRNLENRIKTLKSSQMNANNNPELEVLRIENIKLLSDVDTLKHKLEMQQHHAGALGAAMLQEKLEGQERKIANLELSSKGSTELRAELERLQIANSNLQKSNLRMEAENLDLKLDLEKSNKEVPHLHQQIQHLENYIEVLKSENTKHQMDVTMAPPKSSSPETKKLSELERTVFILKRVVEKLQVENKRLVSGKRPLSDRSASADKLKRDFVRLKEQHSECSQKIEQLQQELEATKNTLHNVSLSRKDDNKILALSDELSKVREQLEVKSGILDRVKILLHRAAAKEKMLLQEISELKIQKGLAISPIPEESDESTSISDT